MVEWRGEGLAGSSVDVETPGVAETTGVEVLVVGPSDDTEANTVAATNEVALGVIKGEDAGEGWEWGGGKRGSAADSELAPTLSWEAAVVEGPSLESGLLLREGDVEEEAVVGEEVVAGTGVVERGAPDRLRDCFQSISSWVIWAATAA